MSMIHNLFDDDDYRVSPWTLGAAGALVLFLALGTTGGLFFRNSFSTQRSATNAPETASWTQKNDSYSSARNKASAEASAAGGSSGTRTASGSAPNVAGVSITAPNDQPFGKSNSKSIGETSDKTGGKTTPITPAKPARDSAAFVATAYRDGSILLVGLVPSERDKERFAEAFHRELPLGSLLINRLEVDPTITLDQSALEIDGQARLLLFDALQTLVKTGVGDPKVTITSSFHLVRPSLLETSLNVLFAAEPIEFAKGSSVIRETSYATIDSATNFLFQDKVGRIRLEGHTDNTGTPEANLRLSAARAEAVRQALIDNGVSADRLTALGRGQSQPISENETDEGKQRNRRVGAVLLEEEEPPSPLTETIA
jgi:outer membrane protein OmpA-like peptidoglycan-associated protein